MKDAAENLVSFRSGLFSSVVKITGFMFIGMFFLPLLIPNRETVQKLFGTFLPSQNDFAIFSSQVDEPVTQLIAAIRESVRVVAKGSDISFTAADRTAWEERNPCRSRTELRPIYTQRKYVKDISANPTWQRVLDEYEILHRVCMSRVGDAKNYFRNRNESTGCKFVVAEAHYGLGNKLLHMASLFVYAVLTQRVILIPQYTYVPPILCEPFAGSSWAMANDFHYAIRTNRSGVDKLYEAMDTAILTNRSKQMDIYASMGGGIWGPELRFWCDTEQSLFSEVTWLTFDGCLHFLPKLFAVTKFRSTMEALFPGRVTLTHVLRTVMLPSDFVWERVLQAKKVPPENPDKQVGVQVRYIKGEKQYKRSNAVVNEHITRCLWENDILPEVCPSDASESGITDTKFANCSSSSTAISTRDMGRTPETKVLLASLFLGSHDHLSDIYVRRMHENVRHETVSIVQLSHEKTQGSGVEVDSQALAEIIALSFSDVLLVTPVSTFGGVAQAYGGLIPYFIENNISSNVACERGLSSEPCYLGAIDSFDCRHDDPMKEGPVQNFVPYLTHCLLIDVGTESGMLLRNDM